MPNNQTNHQERKAFKEYFDAAAARAMAAQIKAVMPEFRSRAFVRMCSDGLDELEFAARVQRFSDALFNYLPGHIPDALETLTRSLPPPLPDCEAVTDGWLQWPIGQFIADHGLPHFEESIQAMEALTTRFSSEFAIRPFVERRPTETFERLLELTSSANPHVRRWCSEGCRPRLPWGKKLHALVADPSPIWPILEALKNDPERYVQKSVANNLNDIAKDHPADVIAKCRSWSKGATEQRQWIIGRALRTLVKNGNGDALAVLGYPPPNNIRAKLKLSARSVKIGDRLEIGLDLTSVSPTDQKLMVDYAVHYVRKTGELSKKVFKWQQTTLAANSRLTLKKHHAMRPTTTRVLYPGRHLLEVQINGESMAQVEFTLDG